MAIRYRSLLPLLKQLVVDPQNVAWQNGQSATMNEKGAEVVRIVLHPTVVKVVDTAIAVIELVLKLLLLTDGKTGAILGKCTVTCCNSTSSSAVRDDIAFHDGNLA